MVGMRRGGRGNPSSGEAREEEQEKEKEDGKGRGEKGAKGWDERWVLLGCILFRLLNASVVRTYFNPDEHWQATEVAHRIVFGYGHLTWEWKRGLRTYLHPLLFAALYKLLMLLKLDSSSWMMIRSPRMFQSLFAAFGDLYLFKLSKHYFGEYAARWTLFCQLINWFTFYCIVRTFSNCLETILTIMTLFYWPQRNQVSAKYELCPLTVRQLALALAAVVCAIRPTSAIVWLYVGVIHFFETHDKLQLILAEAIPIGVSIIGVATIVDCWMYGKWMLVPLNFVEFNIFSYGGEFYGTHPWHWYFSQGFPVMTLSFLPLSIIGVWLSRAWCLAGLIGWILIAYSFFGHKEFRFVLPALPLAMMFSGYFLSALDEPYNAERLSSLLPSYNSKRNRQRWKNAIVVGLLLTNVPMAIYMSLVHQRGSEAAMEYLANEAFEGHVKSVFFMMPCHSTPYYSFLHSNIPMRFLDCSPSDESGYVDEADRFMSDPEGFLLGMFHNPTLLPSHVVLFGSLEERVKAFLKNNGYEQVISFFHAHFPVDREQQGSVLVYARNETLFTI